MPPERRRAWCKDAGPADLVCDNGTNEMDGTVVTAFLDVLNDVGGGGASCFAGYCDWRLPNVKELQSITDYEVFGPSVAPAFHQTATCAGCTDVTQASCSCSAFATFYWSSTTYALPDEAWQVYFGTGTVTFDGKAALRYARAVRGGS